MPAREMPFVTSWAPLLNLILILVVVIAVGFVSWKILSSIKDWKIPAQDKKLEDNRLEHIELRNEQAGQRARLGEVVLRQNGQGMEIKTLREKVGLLGERVDAIGEDQARLRIEHDKNHPLWGKKT